MIRVFDNELLPCLLLAVPWAIPDFDAFRFDYAYSLLNNSLSLPSYPPMIFPTSILLALLLLTILPTLLTVSWTLASFWDISGIKAALFNVVPA